MGSESTEIPRLVIIEGEEKGRVIPLRAGSLTLGRSKADVVVADPRISRAHIQLSFDPNSGELHFKDLDSLNGVLVNKKKQKEGQLFDGDKVQVGNTLLDCHLPLDLAPIDEHTSSQVFIPREPVSMEMDDRLDESELAKPKKEDTATIGAYQISKLRRWYLEMPRDKRVRYLCLVALLFGGLYFLIERGEKGGDRVESLIAKVQKQQGNLEWQAAFAEGMKLKQAFPQDSRTHLLVGDLYLEAQNFELAIAAYQSAKKLKPDLPLLPVKLTRVFLKAGLIQQAAGEMKAIDVWLKSNPPNRELFMQTAKLFIDFPQLQPEKEKLVIVARALQTELAPEDGTGYRLEAQVLIQENAFKTAEPVLMNGLKVAPKDKWLLENLALARFRLKKFDKAVNTVETWLQYYPDSSKALLVMAYLRFATNDLNGSVPYLKRIVELAVDNPKDPHYPESLYLLGQIYARDNRPDVAKRFIAQSCRLGYQVGCQSSLLDKPTDKRTPNTKTKAK